MKYNNLTKYYSIIEFSKIANIVILYSKIEKFNLDSEKIIILCTQTNESIILINNILLTMNKPFIIISGMEDLLFPNEIYKNDIINNKNFIHWFAINNLSNFDGFGFNERNTKIPYGLDYWTLTNKSYFLENQQTEIEQDNILQYISSNSLPLSKRNKKIFCNAHLSITDKRNDNIRSQLKNLINPSIIDYQDIYLKRSDVWNIFSKYVFILSPFGNGLDCIRTFEALCLKCIPIIKSSLINDVYNDLPVLIINEWTDLNEQLLIDTLKIFSNKKFNYDKLTMKYWIDIVLSKFN